MERLLAKAGDAVDFVWIGEDLGTQIAPMISPALYRKILRPHHQKFVDLARSYRLPVMIHCCGSSSWAFEDFIEMGIHAVDTLQPEAANMAPRYLKEHFGGRLSFHGCISTAGALAYGTTEDVERTVLNHSYTKYKILLRNFRKEDFYQIMNPGKRNHPGMFPDGMDYVFDVYRVSGGGDAADGKFFPM